MINNIFQQPNYLYGTIPLSGSTTTTTIPINGSGCVLSYDGSSSQWKQIEPPQTTKGIGYIIMGEMLIPFMKKPNKFQLFLFKMLGGKWKDDEPMLSEEEEINKRRKEILDDILKKNFFGWLWKKL